MQTPPNPPPPPPLSGLQAGPADSLKEWGPQAFKPSPSAPVVVWWRGVSKVICECRTEEGWTFREGPVASCRDIESEFTDVKVWCVEVEKWPKGST
jgi:hypothetical protein